MLPTGNAENQRILTTIEAFVPFKPAGFQKEIQPKFRVIKK